jgi:hypothetical protein
MGVPKSLTASPPRARFSNTRGIGYGPVRTRSFRVRSVNWRHTIPGRSGFESGWALLRLGGSTTLEMARTGLGGSPMAVSMSSSPNESPGDSSETVTVLLMAGTASARRARKQGTETRPRFRNRRRLGEEVKAVWSSGDGCGARRCTGSSESAMHLRLEKLVAIEQIIRKWVTLTGICNIHIIR